MVYYIYNFTIISSDVTILWVEIHDNVKSIPTIKQVCTLPASKSIIMVATKQLIISVAAWQIIILIAAQ